ncbi:ArsR/SmtB family transcription factor [Sutcliffiella rhizosphaerae]|uniref:Cadmium resistance transcriptional regulatory protein CadC n=1 Tax=Sutcliffiella rhizosphaerae TaxID=2880967 RepID=A0ABM8YUM5_9BACI|nr:metalloregulator ArsR/SmtB family transcription factor [Sutcliffiella rhizosphaerae]CAG9623679.1 Cadmium resistance transcriptional regulatory protein CadC [Sutcliffiella rhizosphaerae]
MSVKDTCEVTCFDEEKVNRVQSEVGKEDIKGVANIFKALADENRAKISYALCIEKELCVCDIANIIGSSVATTSHHLRTLYKQGVLKFRKEGKMAFYSLDDEHIRQILLITLEHQKEGKMNE